MWNFNHAAPWSISPHNRDRKRFGNMSEYKQCSYSLCKAFKQVKCQYRDKVELHPPIHIEGTAVEKVESFKFLGVHITDKLKWSTHTDNVVKKAQQRLFNVRRLKKFACHPKP